VSDLWLLSGLWPGRDAGPGRAMWSLRFSSSCGPALWVRRWRSSMMKISGRDDVLGPLPFLFLGVSAPERARSRALLFRRRGCQSLCLRCGRGCPVLMAADSKFSCFDVEKKGGAAV